MDRGTPYKNVICLGHLLDKDGKKMSKSIGNIVEPFEQIEKFGVDAVRYWMYSVNQAGESKNYDEKSVAEINNKVFNLLGNVYSFYELYRDKSLEGHYTESSNVLDQWIIARLNQTIESVMSGLDSYDLFTPTRTIREFCDDLSTWYLRRSRDRLKDGDASAKQTLYIVLKTTAQLLAPFAPFFAEDMWLKLRLESDAESVHLSVWPKYQKSQELSENTAPVEFSMGNIHLMELTREIVTLCLQARQKVGVKVRQPLQSVTLQGGIPNEYIEIIKDEINVKEIKYDSDQIEKVILNLEITPELKLEGEYRELVRVIQDLRKEKGLQPQDMISLALPTSAQEIFEKFGDELKKVVGAKEVVVNGEEIIIR